MSFSLSSILPAILAILAPVITGLVTKFIVNLTKSVDTFAASRPWAKQTWALIVSVVLTLVLAIFHTTDLTMIINALLGWLIAMVLHTGNTALTLPAAPVAQRVPPSDPVSKPLQS